jgi:hypothetical protein
MKVDENGSEYLEFEEKETRTGNGTSLRQFNTKQFANTTNPDRCPIRVYKEYAKRRPVSESKATAHYYLAVNHNRREDGPWFNEENVYSGWDSREKNQPQSSEDNVHLSSARWRVTDYNCAAVRPRKCSDLNNYASASKRQQNDMCQILLNGKNKTGNPPDATAPPPAKIHRHT